MDPITATACIAAGIWMIRKGNQIGARSARAERGCPTPDEADDDERRQLLDHIRRGELRGSVVRYLDQKRADMNRPRRPGVNADLIAKFERGEK